MYILHLALNIMRVHIQFTDINKLISQFQLPLTNVSLRRNVVASAAAAATAANEQPSPRSLLAT